MQTILKTGFDAHNTTLKIKEKLEGPILENIQNLRNVEEKKKQTQMKNKIKLNI